MKTYTFTIDKKTSNTRNNTPITTNYSAIIDNTIRAGIKKNNPWLFGDATYEYYRPNIAIIPSRKKTIDIDIEIPASKTCDTSFRSLAEAIRILNEYKPETKDDYDFKLADGTPVKLFADEIQIGFDLIPLNDLTMALYESLSESAKKNIIDITLIIKKD